MIPLTTNQIQKLYRFEIDQSVWIEELNRDSIIGIANDEISLAYVMPRKIKRYFNELFRRQGKPRQCAPTLFVAAIVAILKIRELEPSAINIDDEYSGYEQHISEFVSMFFPDTIITINRIGRHSPAHAAAYNTHLKHRQPDGIISKQIIREIIVHIEQKKTAAEPHHPGLTEIRKPKQPVTKQYK